MWRTSQAFGECPTIKNRVVMMFVWGGSLKRVPFCNQRLRLWPCKLTVGA